MGLSALDKNIPEKYTDKVPERENDKYIPSNYKVNTQVLPTTYKPLLSLRGLAPWAKAANFLFIWYLFGMCVALSRSGICHCISMGCLNQEQSPPFMHTLDVHLFMYILYVCIHI